MLSTAIIIFREVFEIVIITGIILAATRDLPHRMKWIWLGVGTGLTGAGLVAAFTDSISNFFQGSGQEIFNALVLFTASLCIGLTVIWMKHHAREMKGKFTKVSSDIAEGTLPYYSLSLVIALAMLREGAEIVLFMYGMIASGQPALSLVSGAAIGLASGAVIGGMVYFGLLKLSMKHFFAVTSWLLVLLVAGMTSQGIGFLTAAGYFSSAAHTVWDSSWLLSESSILGRSLGVLMGYTARPSEIQLAAYAAILVTFFILMRKVDKKVTLATAS